MLSDGSLEFGEQFAEALLGLDRLYADEQGKGDAGEIGDIERLVVLNMSTTLQPRDYSNYAAAIEHLSELRSLAGKLPNPTGGSITPRRSKARSISRSGEPPV